MNQVKGCCDSEALYIFLETAFVHYFTKFGESNIIIGFLELTCVDKL